MASTTTQTTTSDVGEDPNEMSPSESLKLYFTYYCERAPATTKMNNSKFAKAIVDMGHINKKFTKTDCGLIFAKVCPKGKKTIGAKGFEAGCMAIAAKKYPKTGESERLAKFIKKSKALPSKDKKKSKGDGVFDRLTDTSKYGGVYGERFDEDGKGKGLDGIDSDRTKGYKREKGILDGTAGDKVDNIKDILRTDKS